ncbi:MAG: flagellar type III secretion system pore protein FliP [Parasporobacterium sp.]|nr:flagellar type III secretion system pore protein FliP [Parasporobacterium sp.]
MLKLLKMNSKKLKKAYKILILFAAVVIIFSLSGTTVQAADTDGVNTINVGDGNNNLFGITISGVDTDDTAGISSTLQVMLIITVIALCPSILIMVTSFTRILIVLHFTRSALNTQSAPPNQILIGISLFLTFFVMAPVFSDVYSNAIVPLNEGTVTVREAYDLGIEPIREFMFNQVDDSDLDTMCGIAGLESVSSQEEVPTYVLIPAFIISELRIAFWIGFLIYIPFIIIDMVVASTLMSMGMMMLPPTTISLPFKILLFVLADGWNLIIVNLINTFVV